MGTLEVQEGVQTTNLSVNKVSAQDQPELITDCCILFLMYYYILYTVHDIRIMYYITICYVVNILHIVYCIYYYCCYYYYYYYAICGIPSIRIMVYLGFSGVPHLWKPPSNADPRHDDAARQHPADGHGCANAAVAWQTS